MIVEDEKGEPSPGRYGYIEGVPAGSNKGWRRQTRSVISNAIARCGMNVDEAVSLVQVEGILKTKGGTIGIALVMEQEPGNKNCLRYLEEVRAKYGEQIAVIGVAETVECMEQMVALRVWKLIGSPLGYVDIDGVKQAIQEYLRR